MSLPRNPQHDWAASATRTHMILSGALSDDTLDKLPGVKESRRPVVIRAMPGA